MLPDIPLDRVTLSLLRVGSDTRAARLLKDLRGPLLPGLDTDALRVEHLADALGLVGAARRAQVGEARHRARLALESAAAAGARFVGVRDDAYPSWLRTIPDPPIGLWVRASLWPLPDAPVVAIVGSRQASPSGLLTARRLARDLASVGVVIVSGLARGIDEAAHRGALEGGGVTMAVLGCGVDVTYPPEHATLAGDVVGHGALISELAPGTPPLPRHFPLRNRIISGLARAVVVVEASEKSGSLITAREALEQGREVLAVPGNVLSGCHRGCHALIKDGATLVESAADVLEQLGFSVSSAEAQDCTIPAHPVLAAMPAGEPIGVDDLAARSGAPVAELLMELTRFELAGLVGRAGSGGFVRLDGPATNRDRERQRTHGKGSGRGRVAGEGQDHQQISRT